MNEVCYGCHNCKYWLTFDQNEYGTCCFISCEPNFEYVQEKSICAFIESITHRPFKTHMDFFCNQHDIAYDASGNE